MYKQILVSICIAGLVLVSTLRVLRSLRTGTIGSVIGSSQPKAQQQQHHRQLLRYYGTKWKITDPKSIYLKDDDGAIKSGVDDATILEVTQDTVATLLRASQKPLAICDRAPPILKTTDRNIRKKYSGCELLKKPPEETTLLILEGLNTFGRTGNNLIELLHAFQYGRDHDAVVAIQHGSWATHMVPKMWMAVQDGDIHSWIKFFERTFCVKIFYDNDDMSRYKKIIPMETRDLFMYRGGRNLGEYVEFQGHMIRNLWRSYNTGIGLDMRQKPVGNMCSVIDAMFGNERESVVYSVIHSRALEGDPGLRLMEYIARKSGCDPVAALDMEPEYVKAILEPLGMLEHPILFITDNQRPEVLEKLLEDPEIGPNIRLIPDEASWVGGDITLAVMANVFIGNPASSFSGFIAKSRVSLGYDSNYMFWGKNDDGEWVDTCDGRCIFNKKVMRSMA